MKQRVPLRGRRYVQPPLLTLLMDQKEYGDHVSIGFLWAVAHLIQDYVTFIEQYQQKFRPSVGTLDDSLNEGFAVSSLTFKATVTTSINSRSFRPMSGASCRVESRQDKLVTIKFFIINPISAIVRGNDNTIPFLDPALHKTTGYFPYRQQMCR